jgi:CheY-like chemotaxis protein
LESKKILLVEDNPRDAELTKLAVQKSNTTYELIFAEDGVEALEYFFGEDGKSGCTNEDLPVVVLLDLKLPRVSGLEVLGRLRANEKTRLVPIVVLTSSNEEKDITGSYDLGANSFIRKPSEFSEFTEAIRQLMYWLTRENPASDRRRK